jgi:hypothetical protein
VTDITVGELVDAVKDAPGQTLRVGPYIVKYIGEFPYADRSDSEQHAGDGGSGDDSQGPERAEANQQDGNDQLGGAP